MAEKKESFFWTSYSDLMTSLFFIMLTLFVLVIVLLNKRMAATIQELEDIKMVQNSTKELDKSDYFTYREDYKKYVLDVYSYFPQGKWEYKDMKSDTGRLRMAGMEIRDFFSAHTDTQYLMIIEGQASRNSAAQTQLNYSLSFQRALTLMGFWKDICKIDFGDNCEIQIAGSGDGRYNFGYTGENDLQDPRFKVLDALLMRERGSHENLNQRFIIHIIPKNIFPDETKQ